MPKQPLESPQTDLERTARWVYLGRGDDSGEIHHSGKLDVFFVWSENGPGNLRAIPREDTPRVLVGLLLSGLSIAASGDHPEARGQLLGAMEEAATRLGPADLEESARDGELPPASLGDAKDRLAEALDAFRRDGRTADGPTSPILDHFEIPSVRHYAALQTVLAQGKFDRAEGSPFPRAPLDREGRSFAELRPVDPTEEFSIPPAELEAMAQRMWASREELSDRDVDTLDALAGTWAAQARDPLDRVAVKVDDLLRMRGIKPKKGGGGRRGGYEPEQRAALWEALDRIGNLWLQVTPTGKKATKTVAQSRAFVITDRVGQRRFDGSIDVQAVLIAPGRVFGGFLFGPGRQVALLHRQALRYHPIQRAIEKRLARYLSWQWRVGAAEKTFERPFRVATLLDRAGLEIGARPARTRERLEEALDRITEDQVLDGWEYDGLQESTLPKRGWARLWADTNIVVKAPSTIVDAYSSISRGAPPKQLTATSRPAPASSIDPGTLRDHRGKLTQRVAAARVGISQATYSRAERGAPLSQEIHDKLLAWLATTEQPSEPRRN